MRFGVSLFMSMSIACASGAFVTAGLGLMEAVDVPVWIQNIWGLYTGGVLIYVSAQAYVWAYKALAPPDPRDKFRV